jgi:hypothetical protein
MSVTGPRSTWKFLFGTALLLAIFVAPARSQNYVQAGSFTLPFEARWGQVKLPAGTYSFLVDAAHNEVIILQGTRSLGIAIVSELAWHDAGKFEKPSMLCVRHDSTYSVRALKLPAEGTLYFFPPKDKNRTVTQAPELIQSVPVTVAGQ